MADHFLHFIHAEALEINSHTRNYPSPPPPHKKKLKDSEFTKFYKRTQIGNKEERIHIRRSFVVISTLFS